MRHVRFSEMAGSRPPFRLLCAPASSSTFGVTVRLHDLGDDALSETRRGPEAVR